MKKFNPIKKIPQTTVPIMQCCLDTEDLDQFRIAIYDNSNKDGKLDTVEIDFVFNTPQQGWGKSQKVKLRNDLYRINNIAYKQPAALQFAQVWYDHAITQARAFGKKHNSNLHTKLGFQFHNRYHTIPYTFFSYCSVTHEFLLQISIPDADNNEFTHHMEVYGELTEFNNKNLRWENFA
jgi:hypothetical protein